MVKKLYKYEFSALLRPLLPLYVLLGVLGLICRGLQLFESEGTAYSILFWSSVVALIIAVIVCFVMTVVVGLVRFYRHLFSAEGYLTLSLPVTPAQHLQVKGTTALAFCLLSLLAAFLAGCIAAAGQPLAEAFRAGVWLLNRWQTMLGGHGQLFALGVELFVLSLLSVLCAFHVLYACLCVGQLSRRHRLLSAFGVFLGLYFLAQLLLTLLLIFRRQLAALAIARYFSSLLDTAPFSALLVLLLIAILGLALLTVLFWLVSHWVLKKRLNLE